MSLRNIVSGRRKCPIAQGQESVRRRRTRLPARRSGRDVTHAAEAWEIRQPGQSGAGICPAPVKFRVRLWLSALVNAGGSFASVTQKAVGGQLPPRQRCSSCGVEVDQLRYRGPAAPWRPHRPDIGRSPAGGITSPSHRMNVPGPRRNIWGTFARPSCVELVAGAELSRGAELSTFTGRLSVPELINGPEGDTPRYSVTPCRTGRTGRRSLAEAMQKRLTAALVVSATAQCR